MDSRLHKQCPLGRLNLLRLLQLLSNTRDELIRSNIIDSSHGRDPTATELAQPTGRLK